MVQFQSSGGWKCLKMAEIDGFWSLSRKPFRKNHSFIASNLVCMLIAWVFKRWFHFGPCWPNMWPMMAKKWLKIWKFLALNGNQPLDPLETWHVYIWHESWKIILRGDAETSLYDRYQGSSPDCWETQGARVSAAMVLALVSWNITTSAVEQFIRRVNENKK